MYINVDLHLINTAESFRVSATFKYDAPCTFVISYLPVQGIHSLFIN